MMNNLLAQATEYSLLAPLPGVTIAENSATSTFATYIPGLFNLIIGVAGVLAVVMIIYGGIQYMSTDAFQGKSDAKNTISNAIWGLILTISAWLILFSIYPDADKNPFVNFNLNIERQELGAAFERPNLTILTTEELGTDSSVREELSRARGDGKVAIRPYAGACYGSVTTGCVNVNSLQRRTIDGLKALATFCSECGVILITGGTEGGHTTGSTHNIGASVDIRSNAILDAVISANGGTTVEGKKVKALVLEKCATYTSPKFPGRFLWEPAGEKCGGEVASSANHWHVIY